MFHRRIECKIYEAKRKDFSHFLSSLTRTLEKLYGISFPSLFSGEKNCFLRKSFFYALQSMKNQCLYCKLYLNQLPHHWKCKEGKNHWDRRNTRRFFMQIFSAMNSFRFSLFYVVTRCVKSLNQKSIKLNKGKEEKNRVCKTSVSKDEERKKIWCFVREKSFSVFRFYFLKTFLFTFRACIEKCCVIILKLLYNFFAQWNLFRLGFSTFFSLPWMCFSFKLCVLFWIQDHFYYIHMPRVRRVREEKQFKSYFQHVSFFFITFKYFRNLFLQRF